MVTTAVASATVRPFVRAAARDGADRVRSPGPDPAAPRLVLRPLATGFAPDDLGTRACVIPELWRARCPGSATSVAGHLRVPSGASLPGQTLATARASLQPTELDPPVAQAEREEDASPPLDDGDRQATEAPWGEVLHDVAVAAVEHVERPGVRRQRDAAFRERHAGREEHVGEVVLPPQPAGLRVEERHDAEVVDHRDRVVVDRGLDRLLERRR